MGTNPNGIAYDSAKGEIFVANWGSNTVSVISDDSDSMVATVPMGTNILGAPHPIGVTYDPAKGEVDVVNSYPDTSGYGSVSVISDSNNTILDSITVGGYPIYTAYDSAKGEIFVTNSEDNFISVISDSTYVVVANIAFPFNEAYGSWGIAYDSADGQVFIANQRGTVYVLSDSLNALVEAAPLGNNLGSDCIAYDAAKGEMFVTNGNNTVSVLSVSPIASTSSAVPEFSTEVFILVLLVIVVVSVCAVASSIWKRTKFN